MGEVSDESRIASYHAHIYYDPDASRGRAERVREGIGRFPVRLGRWHDRPVGPHARAMFQVAFETAEFATLVPWLMLHREGLAVFIHPNTGRPREDHLKHALWLGAVLPLKADVLPETETDTDTRPQPGPDTGAGQPSAT